MSTARLDDHDQSWTAVSLAGACSLRLRSQVCRNLLQEFTPRNEFYSRGAEIVKVYRQALQSKTRKEPIVALVGFREWIFSGKVCHATPSSLLATCLSHRHSLTAVYETTARLQPENSYTAASTSATPRRRESTDQHPAHGINASCLLLSRG